MEGRFLRYWQVQSIPDIPFDLQGVYRTTLWFCRSLNNAAITDWLYNKIVGERLNKKEIKQGNIS
jgi:hypothetical protein